MSNAWTFGHLRNSDLGGTRIGQCDPNRTWFIQSQNVSKTGRSDKPNANATTKVTIGTGRQRAGINSKRDR